MLHYKQPPTLLLFSCYKLFLRAERNVEGAHYYKDVVKCQHTKQYPQQQLQQPLYLLMHLWWLRSQEIKCLQTYQLYRQTYWLRKLRCELSKMVLQAYMLQMVKKYFWRIFFTSLLIPVKALAFSTAIVIKVKMAQFSKLNLKCYFVFKILEFRPGRMPN